MRKSPSLSVNGKQLTISRERVIRGRIALVLILVVTVQYCLFLIPVALPLLLVPFVRARRLYRRWCATVQLLLLGFLGYVIEFVCRIRLVITGADELLHVLPSKPLIISNHRCEIDWMFLVCLTLRLHRLSALKIVTWEQYTRLPFIGWLVQVFMFPPVCGRDKVRDLATLRNTVDYLTAIQHPGGVSMVLFPEGASVLDGRALEKSQAYSDMMGIVPAWSQVLIPRTPGMYETVRSLNRLNALDSVIDVTLGYLDFAPFQPSSLTSFWNGTHPREVHMNLHHTRWVDIPTDFETMQDWLMDKWGSKERMLERFYSPLEIMYRSTSEQSWSGRGEGGIRRGRSGGQSSENSSSSDEGGNLDEYMGSDQLSTSSTHVSNLATLVAFSDDLGSPEPAEETLSKDMRFIQYISNSYVISAVVAMMVNCVVVVVVASYPREALIYVLSVCLVCAFVTRWMGGFNSIELDLIPVQVDVSTNPELYSGADRSGVYQPKTLSEMIKDILQPGKKGDTEYSQRDKDKYIQHMHQRRVDTRRK